MAGGFAEARRGRRISREDDHDEWFELVFDAELSEGTKRDVDSDDDESDDDSDCYSELDGDTQDEIYG
jgi:hypothetical protein